MGRLPSPSPSCEDSAIAVPCCSLGPDQPFSSYRKEQNYLANESVHSLGHSDWFRSRSKAQVDQSESFPEFQCRC